MYAGVVQREERTLLCQDSLPGSPRSQKHCSSFSPSYVCGKGHLSDSLYTSLHAWLKRVRLFKKQYTYRGQLHDSFFCSQVVLVDFKATSEQS